MLLFVEIIVENIVAFMNTTKKTTTTTLDTLIMTNQTTFLIQ